MKSKTTQGVSGMTLVEVMFAVFIGVLVLGMVAYFFNEVSKVYIAINQRTDQAIRLRQFTQDLQYEASYSNQAFIYSSIDVLRADNTTHANVLTVGVGVNNQSLYPSGDCLLFVYYDVDRLLGNVRAENAGNAVIVNSGLNQTSHISRIVGYYLNGTQNRGTGVAATVGTKGYLERFEINFDPTELSINADGVVQVEALVRTHWDQRVTRHYNIIARSLVDSEVTVDAVDPRLFYLINPNTCFMVAGQIYSTDKYSGLGGWLERLVYTDTFNFVITPRS